MNGYHSIRLRPNQARAGDTLMVCVEGTRRAAKIVGKSVTIELLEVDASDLEGDDGDELLAVFSAEVAMSDDMTNFFFMNVRRTDDRPDGNPLVEETRSALTDTKGESTDRDFKPSWLTPHVKLTFEGGFGRGGHAPEPGQEFMIHIPTPNAERELYTYELGLRVYADGELKFDSRMFWTQVDATPVVVHNCLQAAYLLMEDHNQVLAARGVGTHFGSQYIAYLERDLRDGDITKAELDRAKKELKQQKKRYSLDSTSCVVYTEDALKLAHTKSQAVADWDRVYEVYSKKVNGTCLAKGLEEVGGWVGIYYNADTKNPDDGDEWHTKVWNRVNGGGVFFDGLYPKDWIVDYRAKSPRADMLEKLEDLKQVPFALVNGKAGSHVAMIIPQDDPLAGGKTLNVYEVHWDRAPTSNTLYDRATLFEDRWTNIFNSGMIHVPRGYWRHRSP